MDQIFIKIFIQLFWFFKKIFSLQISFISMIKNICLNKDKKISKHEKISVAIPYNLYLKLNGQPDSLIACLHFIKNNSFLVSCEVNDYFVWEWVPTTIKWRKKKSSKITVWPVLLSKELIKNPQRVRILFFI